MAISHLKFINRIMIENTAMFDLPITGIPDIGSVLSAREPEAALIMPASSLGGETPAQATSEQPITLTLEGSIYGTTDTLAQAMALADAGSRITIVDETLYTEPAETVDVLRDNITVDLGDLQEITTFQLSAQALTFRALGTASVDVIGSNDSGETIETDAGFDIIYGGAGNDVIRAGDNGDFVYGGNNDDRLFGQGGFDEMFGLLGDDVLYGGAGLDNLFGGRGDDDLYGGDITDIMEGGKGADRLYGGNGDDVLAGNDGADRLFGQNGEDTLDGGNGADIVNGGGKADILYGGAGRDDLFGGRGGDTAFGGDGADKVYGGNGTDTLSGDGNHDQLYGGRDGDTIFGGLGDDTLYGGGGEDRIVGGMDGDMLFGGAGGDTFEFAGDHGADVILDFQRARDVIDLDFVALGVASGSEVAELYGNQDGTAAVFDFGDGNVVRVEDQDYLTLADTMI